MTKNLATSNELEVWLNKSNVILVSYEELTSNPLYSEYAELRYQLMRFGDCFSSRHSLSTYVRALIMGKPWNSTVFRNRRGVDTVTQWDPPAIDCVAKLCFLIGKLGGCFHRDHYWLPLEKLLAGDFEEYC